MAERVILYTGKGGVGKTSVAAATALQTARSDRRTIVVSTDPAHSLADCFGIELDARPRQLETNLFAQQVQVQDELEEHWQAVRGWLVRLLSDRGVSQIAAEELSVPPGLDEFFSLLAIKSLVQSDDWDTIVVDCAPTGETLRLLSFPEVAQWWLEKIFPWERRLVQAARPLARGLLDLELPSREVFAEIERVASNLVAMNEILRDRGRTSIRLVMNPDRMVIGEAQRTFTYLSLYGFLTDAVIVNRIFPAELDGGYFHEWRAAQQAQLGDVHAAFAPVPVLTAPFFDSEVVGLKMLSRLGSELFATGAPPDALMHDGIDQELALNNGQARLRVPVPFAEKGEINLKKIGMELVVRVADRKRNIVLPDSLQNYRPTGAKFERDALEVTFER